MRTAGACDRALAGLLALRERDQRRVCVALAALLDPLLGAAGPRAEPCLPLPAVVQELAARPRPKRARELAAVLSATPMMLDEGEPEDDLEFLVFYASVAWLYVAQAHGEDTAAAVRDVLGCVTSTLDVAGQLLGRPDDAYLDLVVRAAGAGDPAGALAGLRAQLAPDLDGLRRRLESAR